MIFSQGKVWPSLRDNSLAMFGALFPSIPSILSISYLSMPPVIAHHPFPSVDGGKGTRVRWLRTCDIHIPHPISANHTRNITPRTYTSQETSLPRPAMIFRMG